MFPVIETFRVLARERVSEARDASHLLTVQIDGQEPVRLELPHYLFKKHRDEIERAIRYGTRYCANFGRTDRMKDLGLREPIVCVLEALLNDDRAP